MSNLPRALANSLSSIEPSTIFHDSSPGKYLSRRRYVTSIRERGLRGILEKQFENTIKVVKFGTDGLNEFYNKIVPRLRKEFEDNEDKCLSNFMIDYSDDEGEDSLHYDCEILMPVGQLSNLKRINNISELPNKKFSQVIHIVKAPIDCILTSTLTLKKNQ